ncbi:MAG: PEP-CTERM sorting domain-containing protein [Verrucomicrobia bacterium]|nr:PEP-CTERM sorting domain-containing protein [Verrucomicrobiota bacterium]MCH8526277.1 PEP-CTERM sorting domain-containing protein [Kiritimatiellia bacterium]
MQINGGSWTQINEIAWIQMSGGTLAINGGVFNQGSSGNILRNAASAIIVSGGTANLNGNLEYNPTSLGTLSLTSGTLNVGSEFKPISDFYMTAGTLSANLISFADGPGSIYFSGGTIQVNGSAFGNGLYGGGDKSIDFSTGSTGGLFLDNLTPSEFFSTGFLTNGTIRHNGAISEADFIVSESGSGTLITVIPEPSTLGLVMLSLMAGAIGLRKRR